MTAIQTKGILLVLFVILASVLETKMISSAMEEGVATASAFTEEQQRLCEALLNKGTELYLLGQDLKLSERSLRGVLRIAEEWATPVGGYGSMARSLARHVCLQARLFLGNMKYVRFPSVICDAADEGTDWDSHTRG